MRAIHVLDTAGDWCGRAVSLLILPMILAVSWEVFARYVLDAPTIWAYDTTYMLYGTHFMLGTAYTLLHGGHIRTDMLWEKFSDRRKGLIDAVAYVTLFFPVMVMFFYASIDEVHRAWVIGERSEQTAWRPILYPFKAVVPLTAVLLFVQGISELVKSLYAVRTGRLFRRSQAQLV